MKALFAVFTLLFATVSAHAASNGFYVEPGVVYELKGSGTIKAANPVTGENDISGDQTGPGADVRLGAHIHKLFFAGLEGTYLRDRLNNDALDLYGSELAVGFFGGVQLPWQHGWFGGVRLWGGYLPWAQVNYDRSNGYQPKLIDGSGWKAGLGIRLSIVSLNFEYMKLSYHGADISYTGGNTTYQPGSPDYDHDAFMVGVSFPLAL